jgi:cellulose synthase (UDP-forming)
MIDVDETSPTDNGSAVAVLDDSTAWTVPSFGTHDVADRTPQPPDDIELWSYTIGTGRGFLRFSAISKGFLGSALFFLALRGDWLKLLMPFALMMVAGAVVSIIWSFQVKPFDRRAHESHTRRDHRLRTASVDVYITTCGEDPDVIRNTIWHARHIEHDGDVHVYVLDDKNSAAVRAHALDLGATYIHRPEPGWMKKAGNIHHAYGNSGGEFIIILDADFAARDDFLAHTLGYFEDPAVGIVQTPQYFRVDDDNWVEAGAASQQEQFYRIVQRARDRRGGAICVGTNAVYRRAALDERGGMALLEHSEDLFTGMKVIDAGYRVSYLPLVLAAGSAPDNTRALASQQYRWARGNFALAGTPLFKRLRLTFMQRLSIWDGWIFYVTSGLSPLVAIVVPILTLVEIPEAISIAPTVLLVPALLTEFVIQPRWLYLSNGPASRRVGLISQVAHLFALRDHLSDREQEWVPTGNTAGGRRQATDRIPELIASIGFFAFIATIVGVGIRAAQGFSIVDLAPVIVLAMIAIPTALTVTNAPRPVARVATADVDASRDNYLDVVRGLSIIRVMFWHALGYWWISWAFAAMPAVFYVSGALFAKSMRKRPAGAVVKDRLRRLLPPYVAFLAASLLAISVATGGSVWRTNTVDVISWIVPFQSPAALPWEQGWLSTPLWFLRALIIVLLVTPVAVRVLRRGRPIVWAAVWSLSIVGLDIVISSADTVRATSVLRGIGDVVVFGGFFAAGAAFHHRRHELAQTAHRERILIVLLVLTAAVAWMAPPADWVVNNSNVMMGLVGAVWLVAVILFEPHIRNLGNIPGVRQIVSWVASNSMTVYLWHTAVLCVTFAIVGGVAEPQDVALFMVVFVPLLIGAVVALRPLERQWSTRPGAHPFRILPIAAIVAVAAILVQQPTLFPETDAFTAPPAPSARPETGEEGPVPDDVTSTGGVVGWVTGNRVREAIAVTVAADGEHVSHSYSGVGTDEEFGEQELFEATDTFEALSLTKTMVATVALQLVDEGVLTLDGPLPALDGVDAEVTDALTIRRLLSHATGLVDYRQAEGFDPTETPEPLDAVNAAIAESDLAVTEVEYSSTNYFIVGMVIEQVTDSMLGDQLDARLFEPLGMDDTELVNNYRAGFVGYSSGGVVSTLDDLATWYDALVSDGIVLSDEMLDEMIWGGRDYNDAAGLGAWRHCPCRDATVEDPDPFLYLFHDGGDVRISYHPDEDVVMVSRFSKPLYGTPALAGDIDGFILQVLDEVA